MESMQQPRSVGRRMELGGKGGGEGEVGEWEQGSLPASVASLTMSDIL